MGRVRYIVEALQELGAVELAVGVLVTEAEHIGRLIEGVRSGDGSPISGKLVDAAIAIRAGQQREIGAREASTARRPELAGRGLDSMTSRLGALCFLNSVSTSVIVAPRARLNLIGTVAPPSASCASSKSLARLGIICWRRMVNSSG